MTSLATSVTIVAANPLDHASDIKQLFLENDHPDFPEFFDRTYPLAVETGGKSWIAVDAGGHVVMHIARFPRQFVLGERMVRGGVLLSLMAAKSHRTFFPALALMRHVIADSKSERDVDFLYGTPTGQAGALFKAAGLSTVGTLQRFVFPLAGARWYTKAATRVYQAVVRVRSWTRAAKAIQHAAQRFDAGAFARPVGASPALRPLRPPELYRQCLAGYPSRTDYWFTFHRAGSTRPSAAALVRGGADGVATLFSLSRDPSLPVAATVPGLAAALRRAGYRRLAISTVAETPFARELTRAGFLPRPECLPMMVYALTDLGADALRSAATSEIARLDCDPYNP